jgi:four helix bundle protein
VTGDLVVWQKSLSFVEGIYDLTQCFPEEEKYGLTNQMRGASVSIPSNISESAARKGKNEFEHYLYISLGSIAEVETQLELARRLGFAQDAAIFLQQEKLTEIRRLIQGIIRHLKNSDK